MITCPKLPYTVSDPHGKSKYSTSSPKTKLYLLLKLPNIHLLSYIYTPFKLKRMTQTENYILTGSLKPTKCNI